MEIGGKILKHLASLKEKYNMEQEDIDEMIILISDLIIDRANGSTISGEEISLKVEYGRGKN